MGTTYSVLYVENRDTPHLRAMKELVDAELTIVNLQMSTYLPESEISRFNRSRSTNWFDISAETARVIELAQHISAISSGAFDITVGPLVNLWGFGAELPGDRIPDDEEIESARSSVGYQRLEIRIDPPAIKKSHPELQIDLSAIAKGHGVDRVGSVLSSHGIEHYFVEIGGEIVTRGVRPDGDPWRVGIEAPVEGRTVQAVLHLSNAAIATSGDYRNYFEHDGHHYSHTINPATGRPVEHSLASASVVDENCELADAIATCMMVLGPDKGMKLAEENRWSVYFLQRGSNPGQLVSQCSSEFAKQFPDVCKSISP